MHLGYDPIEGFSVDDFCYTHIILDIDDPKLETLWMAGSRRSIMRSTPQMGASPQLAYSDDSALTANDVYNENRSNLLPGHWAPTIKVEKFDTEPENPGAEHKACSQEWRNTRYISSDETEEDTSYMRQNMAENAGTQQLEDICDQNQKLLVWSSVDDKNDRQNINPDRRLPVMIKQEPNYTGYAAHEVPCNYAPQQRYIYRQRPTIKEPPSNNIFVTKGQPPNYYTARRSPREDNKSGRKYNSG